MPAIDQDQRARLQPKNINEAGSILGPNDSSNLLYPLWSTNGVLFPYTPDVSTGAVAEYDSIPYVHSNYIFNSYIRSYPKSINVKAEFTAQSNDEALYLLAVIHFFRSVTKNYFGVNPYNKAGTPPPVLQFNYLGEHQFNNVPVVVKTFDYSYPNNIDYVPVNTTGQARFSENIRVSLPAANSGGYTWVPTKMDINVELETQYIPIKLRNDFNLDEFRSGKLIKSGFI
jgi:hypothetical protein